MKAGSAKLDDRVVNAAEAARVWLVLVAVGVFGPGLINFQLVRQEATSRPAPIKTWDVKQDMAKAKAAPAPAAEAIKPAPKAVRAPAGSAASGPPLTLPAVCRPPPRPPPHPHPRAQSPPSRTSSLPPPSLRQPPSP